MGQSAPPDLQILHNPHGIEDPYTPRPWERTPREPRAGEDVSIAVVTRPASAVDAVSVHVSCTREESRVISAAVVAWEGEGTRWEAHLGAFPAGARVSYQAVALSNDRQSAVTDPYAFDVASRRGLGRVAAWRVIEGGVVLRLSDGQDSESSVVIDVMGPGEARIRVWPNTLSEAPASDDMVPATVRQEGADLIVEGADLTMRIGLTDGAFAARRRNDKEVRSATRRPLLSLLIAGYETRAVQLAVALTDDEALYGTGERFDAFDRRGLRFDTRVYEQYKNQGSRTYLPVPLILSSRGYALSIAGTRPLRIDAGASTPDELMIEADVDRTGAAPLEARLFLASTPLDALHAYLRRAGLPVVPPEWTFGVWMSGNDWNSQARVLAEVERAEREGIPGDVMVIEAWTDESTFYIWNDAQYDLLPADHPPRLSDFRFPPDGLWPDPKGMIDRLHAAGIRLLLWQIPLLKDMGEETHAQNSADIDTVIRNGWCAHNPDGTPYRNPGWWFPGALLPDLTNPEARDWWLARRRYLVEEMGVDGFKTDGGEHIWGRDVVFADGRRGDEMINAFPVLYAAAYHHLLKECGREDGLTFSRAGYAGSQRYPAHWAGDENSTWEAFRHSIVAGLSAGASGIPFWGWDIAGFSEEIPTGELYRRAWMMAAFCPIMQYHSEYNARREPSRDRTPWNIAARTGDPHVLPVCRSYTALRRRLRPYILREAAHTAETGRPLMCALPLAYPDDPRLRAYPYQYLFGRDLLVAPTVEEGATTQEVYLPVGTWRDLWTWALVEGPCAVTVTVPPHRIPVYVRAGAMAPLDAPWGGGMTDA